MSQITEIIVPELVKSIDSEVFNNCANLAYVEWNAKNCEDYSTEYKIMRKPFYECPSINEIKIGNNVEHLPAGCFYGAGPFALAARSGPSAAGCADCAAPSADDLSAPSEPSAHPSQIPQQ